LREDLISLGGFTGTAFPGREELRALADKRGEIVGEVFQVANVSEHNKEGFWCASRECGTGKRASRAPAAVDRAVGTRLECRYELREARGVRDVARKVA
jgi:hypothetical protein